MLFFPKQKYSIIYADPPWTYKDKAQSGNRGAGFKYDLMRYDDIANLPVSTIARKDAFLFLWVTMPLLSEGIELIHTWGFNYKTVAFTWVKTTKHNKLFFGMGNWTRANAELCLLGIRGKPKRKNAGVPQIIMSPIEEHSKKPAEVRERIVKLCGNLKRIELFARQKVKGWNAWGNEV